MARPRVFRERIVRPLAAPRIRSNKLKRTPRIRFSSSTHPDIRSIYRKKRGNHVEPESSCGGLWLLGPELATHFLRTGGSRGRTRVRLRSSRLVSHQAALSDSGSHAIVQRSSCRPARGSYCTGHTCVDALPICFPGPAVGEACPRGETSS